MIYATFAIFSVVAAYWLILLVLCGRPGDKRRQVIPPLALAAIRGRRIVFVLKAACDELLLQLKKAHEAMQPLLRALQELDSQEEEFNDRATRLD